MKRFYTNEQIRECCFAYRRKKSVKELSKELNIPRSTLYFWIKNYKDLPENDPDSFLNFQRYHSQQKARNDKLEQTCEILQTVDCTVSSPLKVKLYELEKLYGKYSVHVLCDALDVNRATFYNHIFRNKKENALPILRLKNLKTVIKDIFDEFNGIYGARKIHFIAKERGYVVSLKTVQRLMSEMGLKSIRSLTKKDFLKKLHTQNRINVLQRNFSVDVPNTHWVGDISQCYILNQKFHICAILDLFSRKIIACKIGNTASTNLVISTFKMAYHNRIPVNKLVFHNDQGGQYVSYTFQRLLHDLNVVQSFSKPGTPYDNSVMESFFASLKQEELYRTNYRSIKDFKESLARYIDFYNSQRPHETNAYKSPNEKERLYFLSKKQSS